MYVKKIVNNYCDWLNILIQKKPIDLLSRFIISNSIDLLIKYYELEYDILKEYQIENKEYINNKNIKELSHFPKYHLFLYSFFNRNSKLNEFILEWFRYMKKEGIVRNGFPFGLSQSPDILIDINNLKLDNIEKYIKNYYYYISDKTEYGHVQYLTNKEINIHFLKASVILLYRNKYDIIAGNYALRSLFYLTQGTNNDCIEQLIQYLLFQQNPKGYFGNYLKDEFNNEEISSILNISLNSCITIMEHSNRNIRIDKEILNYFNS